MPLLSIIVPVYNTNKYLKQCLDSIVNQYNNKFELIIVDDGSTDECPAVCDEYADNYDFIRVIHKLNEGLLLARRTGIKEAKGEYIAHVDSDDYVLDGYIETICNVIENNPCDMLFFDYIYGADAVKSERIIHIRDEKENTKFDDQKVIIDQYLSGGNLNAMWMKITKKSVVDVDADYTPYKSVANGEDVLQSLALIDNSHSYMYVPTPLYYYRRDNVSMSKMYKTKDYQSFRIVNLKIQEYADKWNVEEGCKRQILVHTLDKNMVILHQVWKNEGKDALISLMKTMSNDPYFLNLAGVVNTNKVSSYYNKLYKFIARKHFYLARLFMKFVAAVKK